MPRKGEPGDEGSAFDDLDKMIEAEGDGSEGGAAEEERLHPILSNEEVLAARASARAKVDAQRRKAAMKRIEDEEVERLRLEEGLTTGDRVQDEIVDIVLDLAPHSDKIVINSQAYHHGFTYTVPRHVANSLREMMARGWAHQDEIDGKNKTQTFLAQRQFGMLRKGKADTSTGARVGKAGVSGVLPKNFGVRAGPEDHAHV